MVGRMKREMDGRGGVRGKRGAMRFGCEEAGDWLYHAGYFKSCSRKGTFGGDVGALLLSCTLGMNW
jgi:hypothetical protein